MRWIAPLGALAAVVIVIAGCTSEPEPDETSPTIPTISEPPTTTAESAPSTTTEQTSTAPTSEAPSAQRSKPNDGCAGWNTKKDVGGSGAGSDIEIYQVRSGLHGCYQRLVFDLNGVDKDVHYQVEYVDTVYTEGKGDPLPIPGSRAYLQVVIFAPAEPVRGPNKQPVAVGGYAFDPNDNCGSRHPVCGVRYGGAFEGQSTFAIGLAAQTPFAARSQVDGSVTKVVVDVAYGP